MAIEVSIDVTQARAQVLALGLLGFNGLRRKINPILAEIGIDLVGKLKQASPRDEGRMANSHAFAQDRDAMSVTIFNRVKYSIYVHEGFQPNRTKQPPIGALLPWARRKVANNLLGTANALRSAAGISGKYGRKDLVAIARRGGGATPEKRARQLAFLVGRAILRRKGLATARPWFKNIVEGYQSTVDKLLAAAFVDFVEGIKRGDVSYTQTYTPGTGGI